MKKKANTFAEGIMRMATIDVGDFYSSHSESFGGYTYSVAQPRSRVTTCKNCGAPVHNNVCEYCGTEY